MSAKNNIKLNYIFLCTLLFAAFLGCSKGNEQQVCKPVYPIFKDSINMNLCFLKNRPNSLIVSTDLYDSTQDCRSELDANLWNSISQYVDKFIVRPDGKLWTMILFSSKVLHDKDSININDISGLQLYYLNARLNKLYHKFAIRINHSFSEIKKYSCEVSFIDVSSMKYFEEKEMNTRGNNDIRSIIWFYPKESKDLFIPNSDSKHLLQDVISRTNE